jgi:hypothetical protein
MTRAVAALTPSRTTTVVLHLVLLLIPLVTDAKPSAIQCGPDEYLSHPSSMSQSNGANSAPKVKSSSNGRPLAPPSTGVTCVPCSTCPSNQIVRRPCTKLSDTVCGALYDFEFLNDPQQPVQLLPSSPASSVARNRVTAASSGDAATSSGRRLVKLRGWRPHSPSSDSNHVIDRDGASDVTETVRLVTPTKGDLSFFSMTYVSWYRRLLSVWYLI